MKRKNLLIITLFSFFLLHLSNASAQILTNAGFESWATGQFGFLEPVGWQCNNIFPTAVVAQGAGRTGSYSANIKSYFDGSDSYGGQIGYFYIGTLKPLVLSGYWRGNFSSGNYLSAQVFVGDASSNPIGDGILNSPTSNLANWTAFSDMITYTSTNTPASSIIQIVLNTNSASTSGYVDDLQLTYVTGIGEIGTLHLLGAWLSHDVHSGNCILTVDLMSPSVFDVEVYDVMGKRVSAENYNLQSGHHEIPVSTDGQFNEGIYFCRVKGTNMDKTFKFITR